MGFKRIDEIIEFPITLMDAYLFTYMKIKEENIVSTFENTLKNSLPLTDVFEISSAILQSKLPILNFIYNFSL